MEDTLMLWLIGTLLAAYVVLGTALWIKAEIDERRWRKTFEREMRRG